ncbi:MAG: glycosyltransferase [Hyphomonadaceae bacterium]|nr:glycosyltransferase [Hyphomonadaceae bacterium]MBC6412959.1 glycosyltransferase [Hyphomonadaceae bacterium]
MARLHIKFIARVAADQDAALWLSLFPGRDPVIGECEFTFDMDARAYDWLVVYEGLPFPGGDKKSSRIEPLACARENTLFITTEPSSVKIYGPQFLRQFGHVLSVQPKHIINHPNHIFHTPPLRWYHGRPMDASAGPGRNVAGYYTDIDEYMATPPPRKTKDLSIVCSSKQMSPAFRARYRFTEHLKSVLGDRLEWFGWGVRAMHDKAEAMDAYRYHIAIENHLEPHHWTEKITDSYLAYCLPFYHGAPNLSDYFPRDSFIAIDIFDIATSTKIILEAMESSENEKRADAVKEARKLTLTKHNLMNVVSKIVFENHRAEPASGRDNIYDRHVFRQKNPLATVRDMAHRARYKLLA